jgi:hypothetical protein
LFLDIHSADSSERPYLTKIKETLQRSTDQSVFDEAFKIYMAHREANKTSPSFYIYCSQLFNAV